MTPKTLTKEREEKIDKILIDEGIYSTSEEDRKKLVAKIVEAVKSRSEIEAEYKTKADTFTGFLNLQHDAKVFNGENDEALKAFERDMQVSGSWSWYPARTSEESTWRKFRKAVCRIYEEDSQGFSKYNTWRMQPYVKGAMTNLGIRRNPELFEESYVGFLAQTGATGSPNVTEYKPRGISA